MDAGFVRIAKWRKRDGEHVRRGDILCELETAKAIVEFEAWDTGTLRQLVEEGAEFSAGAEFAEIERGAPPTK
jgi:pyruvate/2-oxoglutarate dehydrogenase complex dihydrolipoamide acyltransferase (E2) component